MRDERSLQEQTRTIDAEKANRTRYVTQRPPRGSDGDLIVEEKGTFKDILLRIKGEWVSLLSTFSQGLENIGKRILDLETDVSSLQADNTQLQNQIAAIQAAQVRLENRVQDVELDIQRLQGVGGNQPPDPDLQFQLQQLQNDIENLQREAQDLDQRVRNLEL